MVALVPGNYIFTATNGLTFTYAVRGAPSPGRSVMIVQCPGWGIGSRYLQIGLAPLERDFTIVYFHPRGSSGSSRPRNASSMSSIDMAQDLDLFRQHLGLDQFPAILGHSNGGTIALAYAELFPNRIIKLLLLDHRLLGHNDAATFSRFEEKRKGDSRYKQAYHSLANFHPTDDEEMTQRFLAILPIYFFDPDRYLPVVSGAISEEPIRHWCTQTQLECDRDPAVGERLVSGLRNVRAQAMIIFGRQDCVCSVNNAELTGLGIKHAETVIFDRCGHFPWVERKHDTFAVMEKFLNSRERTP